MISKHAHLLGLRRLGEDYLHNDIHGVTFHGVDILAQAGRL